MKQTIQSEDSARWALHVTVVGHSTVHLTVLNTVFSPCLAVYFWSNPPNPQTNRSLDAAQRAPIGGNMGQHGRTCARCISSSQPGALSDAIVEIVELIDEGTPQLSSPMIGFGFLNC